MSKRSPNTLLGNIVARKLVPVIPPPVQYGQPGYFSRIFDRKLAVYRQLIRLPVKQKRERGRPCGCEECKQCRWRLAKRRGREWKAEGYYWDRPGVESVPTYHKEVEKASRIANGFWTVS